MILGYGFSLGLLLLSCSNKKMKAFFFLFKCLTSFLFVFIALQQMKNQINFILLVGFGCCLVGDAILGLYRIGNRRRLFLEGLFLFLIAHLAFVLAIGPRLQIKLFVFPLLMEGVLVLLLKYSSLSVGRMRKWILVYTFFVSLLVSSVFSMSGLYSKRVGLEVGSVLFFFSDFILLYLNFSDQERPYFHELNLLLYYSGMGLLALNSGMIV